jgi:Putative peptidoglycan binding domain/CHAP domain
MATEKTLPKGVTAYSEAEEMPEDKSGEDGDDQRTSKDRPNAEMIVKGAKATQQLWSTKATVASVVVPFCHTLRYGARGSDVRAVQRALIKAQVRKKEPTGRYLGATVLNVKTFQKRAGLKADGIYGEDTHKKLIQYFDAWGAHLYRTACADWKEDQIEVRMRAKIKSAALYGYEMRSKIRYTQSGLRMEGVREKIRPPDVPTWEDCSSFVTWLYWLAGAPDPNGLNYNGYGFTGTQIQHGHEVSRSAAKDGDLVFYGRSDAAISHVAVIVTASNVVSHGSDPGPNYLGIDYRSDRQQIRSYL